MLAKIIYFMTFCISRLLDMVLIEPLIFCEMSMAGSPDRLRIVSDWPANRGLVSPSAFHPKHLPNEGSISPVKH